MFITYPDVDNLSACEVGSGWRPRARVVRMRTAGGWRVRARVVRTRAAGLRVRGW